MKLSALEWHEQHLALARKLGDLQAEAQALGNLGVGYKKLDQLTKAMDYYEQHITLARLIGDRRSAAIGTWNLGLLLIAQGEIVGALPFLESCVACEEELCYSLYSEAATVEGLTFSPSASACAAAPATSLRYVRRCTS